MANSTSNIQAVRDIVLRSLSGLQEAEYSLVGAIKQEGKRNLHLREMEASLEKRVNAALIQATAPGGRLDGIAKTSKQYEFSIAAIRNEVEEDGCDDDFKRDLRALRRMHAQAQVAKMSATARMDAAKARARLVLALDPLDKGDL